MKFFKMVFSDTMFVMLGPGTKEGFYNFAWVSGKSMLDYVLYDYPLSFFTVE